MTGAIEAIQFFKPLKVSFEIIDSGIADRDIAEQIKEIKESLNTLEGGKVVDV